jgi:HPt (histidine-containing phosphotransfer) domain-containing protein
MARKQPIELFMPPNMLKAKVGGGAGGPDIAAMERADQALTGLQSEFDGWVAEDVRALTAARAACADGLETGGRDALLRTAHDMKGQAATFNYPLIARVAASLSRLVDELPRDMPLPLPLVDAHVDAILAIHKTKLQQAGDNTAQALCAELDARVCEVLKSRGKK